MKIDDFRLAKFWKNENFEEITYHQKDNGHKACVMQPFWQKVIVISGVGRRLFCLQVSFNRRSDGKAWGSAPSRCN